VGFTEETKRDSWTASSDSEAAVDHPPETSALLGHFAALKDPRQLVKVLYPLPEVVLLVLCATIVGAGDFVEVQHWGKIHLDFLRRFLPYEHGIPGHDVLA
jgi:hypothetical protein